MSRGLHVRVVRQTRAILYEDNVTRKASKLHPDEPLTLNTARVAKTLSSGEEIIGVELTAYKRSSKEHSATKFQIDLSGPYWRYHRDVEGLKLLLSVTDASGRLKRRHVLKMESRRQLAAWTAELIQASTFQPERTLQRCFHVALGGEEVRVSQSLSRVQHGVLQIRQSVECMLVIHDPLSLEEMRCWDLSQLESFVFEFFPHLCLRVQQLQSLSQYRTEDYIFFLSADVAQESLAFMEFVFQSQLPHIFQTAERLEYRADTSGGTSTRAVAYNMKQSKHEFSIKKSRSTGDADCGSRVQHPHLFSYDSTHPYAVAQVVPRPTSQQSSLQTVLPPSNLIRPGVVVPRVIPDSYSYVHMSRVVPPLVPKLEKSSVDSDEESDDYEEVPNEESDDYEEVPNEDSDDYVEVPDEDDCEDYTQVATGVTPSVATICSELHLGIPDDSDSHAEPDYYLTLE